MKSLEIVNVNIRALEILRDNKIPIAKEHLKQIQRDLEALNILKNKEVDIFLLNDALKSHKYDIEGALKFYNNEFIEEYQLTLDEIYTINKWLRGE